MGLTYFSCSVGEKRPDRRGTPDRSQRWLDQIPPRQAIGALLFDGEKRAYDPDHRSTKCRSQALQKIARAARTHWFYVMLPVLLAAALNFHATHSWAVHPRFGEAATLFDWCLFVPFLYAISYRAMPWRALAMRTLALVCGGIWIAGKIVPDPAKTILEQWGWLRTVGMGALLLAEGAGLIAVLRVAFGSTPNPAELERQGMPPLLVKLMLAEARFWRGVWSRLQGK